MENNLVKCPNCGAPLQNGRCTYCNYMVPSGRVPVPPQTPPPAPNQQGNARFDAYKQVVTRQKKKPSILKIALWVFVVLMVLGFIGSLTDSDSKESTNTTSETSTENNSVWASEPTDISEFDYYLDGDEIYLKDYNGRDKKVRIDSTYTIDGKDRHVVALVDGTFALGSVESVIVPDGTRTIEGNTFNSCGVKFVYLPASLTDVPNNFWGYFHKAQKIYYGGTEEQWNQICEEDRGSIDVVEIVYEANVADLY